MESDKKKQYETIAKGASLFGGAVRRWYRKFEIPRLEKLFDFDEKSLKYRAIRSIDRGVKVIISVDNSQISEANFDLHYQRHYNNEELFPCLIEDKPLDMAGDTDWDKFSYVFEARRRAPSLQFLRGKVMGVFESDSTQNHLYVVLCDIEDVAGFRGYHASLVVRLDGSKGGWGFWHDSPQLSVVKRQMTVNAVGDRFGMTVPPHHGEKAYFRKLESTDLLDHAKNPERRRWRIIDGEDVGSSWPSS